MTLLSGVEALVRLLVLRRQLDERDGLTTATMVSGYPGSPLGTFDLVLEAQGEALDANRIVHRPGLNEELAAATVWGSQMGATLDYSEVDGVAGVWYGKGPGLDRAGDAMKHANAMGAGPNGGVVMFCGDDPTAKSSTLTCDSQYTFEDACMPVLYPGDQQGVVDLGIQAFKMSRYSGAWVGLKIVTTVADGLGTVDLDVGRHHPSDPPDFAVDGQPWRHQPLATIGPHQVPNQEVLVVEHRLRAAQAYARHNRLDRVVGAAPGARLGIVCAGKTYFDVVQAFADLGVAVDELADVGVRVLRLAMTYPLVAETVVEFAASVDELVVIEEKRPFVETQVRSILHEARSPVPVFGKRDGRGNPLASSVGELDPAAVANILAAVSPSLASRRAPEPTRTRLPVLQLPGRAPGFCSGCPHNRSTVVPAGALVGGGVGCHGIMYFEARHQGMKSLAPTPMGAEGVPWIGLAPFVDEPHLIQNIGDGTLSHSGTLAIRASVAARVDVTFKILYNRAVAMTGGQDVTGLLDVPALTRALEAEGVRKVVVCAEDPKRYGRGARWASGVEVLGRDHLPDVQERLREIPGVTVIVYDQRCAAEARRLRKRGELEEPPQRVVINEAVCEGCGDCSTKSNCLSVLPLDTEFGEKRMIHDLSCNRDYTCLEGDCPSFVTLAPKRRGRRRAAALERRSARSALPTGTLAAPVSPTVDGQYGIYFTGIGGTGVVTANRILAAAAEGAGFTVEGMDQTGLSQKAGAVTSHLHFAVARDALGVRCGRQPRRRPVPVGRHPPGREPCSSRQGEARPHDRGDRPRLHTHRVDAAERPARARPRDPAARDRGAGRNRSGRVHRLDPHRGGPAREPPPRERRRARRRVPTRRAAAVRRRPRARLRAAGRDRREQPRRVRVGSVGGAGPLDRRRAARPGGARRRTQRERLRPVARRAGAGDAPRVGTRAARGAPRPPHPARRAGDRLPERGARNPAPRPRRTRGGGRRCRSRMDADARGRRVVVQVAHLQGRVRGGAAAPEGRLRPRRRRPGDRRPVRRHVPAAPADLPADGTQAEAATRQALRVRLPRAAPDEARARHAVRRLRVGPRPAARAEGHRRVRTPRHRPSPVGGTRSYDELVALAESPMAIKGYGPIKEAAVERWRAEVARGAAALV